MKTKSKRDAVAALFALLVAGLYGAVLHHSLEEGPSFTHPPTDEEIAAFRAAMPKSLPLAKGQAATDENQPSDL